MKTNYHPVAFVGAGPGDPDLITIKGKKIVEEADIIIYAGSLINKEIISGVTSELHDSAKMYLEEIISVIHDGWKQGKKIVRLHTGDPSIFGAIKEQMNELDELGIEYYVVPGVSSAFGVAASLREELTLPEISQTVIITRQSGRTPVPDLEKLKLLATHQATMMIFLSVSMIDDVVEELKKGGYQDKTPVVVVQKATWKDEKIIRGALDSIAEKVKAAQVQKTAIICVGQVFSEGVSPFTSKLYDKKFSHGTRKAMGKK